MAVAVCGHDDAMALDPSDIHEDHASGMVGTDVYNCPDCGEFFYVDDEGNPEILNFDPSEPKTGDDKDGRFQTSVSATIPSKDGNGTMLADDRGKPSKPGPKAKAVQGDVSTVPGERAGGKLLPANSQAAPQASDGKRTNKEVSGKAEVIEASVLPGPWAGAPCPNLAAHGCKGILQPFYTLKSAQYGNDYFYRCTVDYVQVVLSFKESENKQ